MRKFSGKFIYALVVLIQLSAPAGAAVLYSTFGPSQSFDTTRYVVVDGLGGTPTTPYQGYASAFTVADNYTVTKIDVALAGC